MLNMILERLTSSDFIESLICAAAGMAGIFIVVGIIILSIVLLNKFGTIGGKKSEE